MVIKTFNRESYDRLNQLIEAYAEKMLVSGGSTEGGRFSIYSVRGPTRIMISETVSVPVIKIYGKRGTVTSEHTINIKSILKNSKLEAQFI